MVLYLGSPPFLATLHPIWRTQYGYRLDMFSTFYSLPRPCCCWENNLLLGTGQSCCCLFCFSLFSLLFFFFFYEFFPFIFVWFFPVGSQAQNSVPLFPPYPIHCWHTLGSSSWKYFIGASLSLSFFISPSFSLSLSIHLSLSLFFYSLSTAVPMWTGRIVVVYLLPEILFLLYCCQPET